MCCQVKRGGYVEMLFLRGVCDEPISITTLAFLCKFEV